VKPAKLRKKGPNRARRRAGEKARPSANTWRIARQLCGHRGLILNYFRARSQISCGGVEAMNNNARLSIRKAYGFRTFAALKTALFHQLGAFPEPHLTYTLW